MNYSICLTLCGLLLASAAVAAPFVPRTDNEVLEHLPFRPTDPVAREINGLRRQLAEEPQNMATALQLARSYFAQAGAQSDPRYVGYAQAALKPWWSLPNPPAPVLVMRATLRQYGHDFAGALADLDAALLINPADVEALSLRADINLVTGDYAASRKDCARMSPYVTTLTDAGCVTFIEGMTGRARQSHDVLLNLLNSAKNVSPEQRLWLLTRLAEMEWLLNDVALAEAHFKRALALNVVDGFLLAAYADFLLDYGRPREVLVLLKDWSRADPMLLRLTLAAHMTGDKVFAEHQTALAARYAAARMRGDTTHEQEESRFTLVVLKQPEEALRLAQSNWRVQREPRDARALLEAALAANKPAAAKPVLDWMEMTAIEDWYLRKIAAQLASLGGAK
jgi:tetratricopeptide (TPR) repeat protein